jgi:HEAT repeat protein
MPATRDADESVRRIALDELGRLESVRPVDVLIRALRNEPDSIQRIAMLSLMQLFVEAPADQSHEIRTTVAARLQNLDTPTVAQQLVDVVAETQEVAMRRNAIWLLGHTVDSDVECRDAIYDCLLDLLDDPDDMTAQLAAVSLTNLDSEALKRRLHILIDDENASEDATERARFVLEEIGGDLSRELITNAVDYTYVGEPVDYTHENHDDDTTAEPDS